jgi:hypothetical protein
LHAEGHGCTDISFMSALGIQRVFMRKGTAYVHLDRMQAYAGNRAPVPIYMHTPWMSQADNQAGVSQFIDYALAQGAASGQDDVWVSGGAVGAADCLDADLGKWQEAWLTFRG